MAASTEPTPDRLDWDGSRWSFELDLEADSEGAGPDWDDVGQEAFLADEVAARERDEPPTAVVTGATGANAEALPAGPGLAGFLARQDPETAQDRDLVGMAEAFRRVASWAQAGELALVAQVAVRSAAADPRAGLAADGRPALLTEDATAQVSLGLTLSHTGAEAWTGLAVTLRWRLPGTAAALAAGRIDTYRAKILAEAVIPLSDGAARAVEDRVLPRAGDLTYGQLHAAVRRAVIAADPEGAEHRRTAAERRAKVSLYADQDDTATLVGSRLPATWAAAAFARIGAMANAMEAAGAGGGIHFLRAQVFLGLILGTLPPIPPPTDGPPDDEPPPDDEGGGEGSAGWAPEAGGTPHDGTPPNGTPPNGTPHDGTPHDGAPQDGTPPNGRPPDGNPSGGGVGRARGDQPVRPDSPPVGGLSPRAPASSEPPPGPQPANGQPPGPAPGRPPNAGPLPEPPPVTDPWPEVPPLTDADLPEDDGYRDTGPPLPDRYGEWDPARGDPLDDHFARPDAQWPWPAIPPAIPGVGRGASPAGGLLELTLPWATLTCAADAPGILGRIGPVSAVQARQLARLANRGYQTQWRVILTDSDDRCVGVGRVPRIRPPAGPQPPGLTDVVGRVTVVLPAAVLDGTPSSADRRSAGIYAEIISAARRALAGARRRAAADLAAAAGCAHTEASASYRPPPRVREYVVARDVTCRYPSCGQPSWRGDLDHTHPWDEGGLTCPCNMGALCRRHHRLKQLRGWNLVQPRPGMFRWVTPAGRTYAVQPDRQPS
jgi:hypothetical protein